MQLNETGGEEGANGSSWRTTCDLLPSGSTWEELHEQLGWMLLLHVYGFGFCFFVLAFYAFFSILNLRSLISSRPFMATINVFLCLLGASRAASLFIDPYSLSLSFPKAIGSILWDLGFPCVTSALCLIQLALLQLTQLKFGPKKLRSKSCLSCVVTSHFGVVIGADVAVAFSDAFLATKYSLQVIYITWTVFLCVALICVGHKVKKLVGSVPSSLLACGPLDANHKGIMQLAMLAPYNNLATSVAAALVPTLLAPKIRVTDENERSQSLAPASDQASTTASAAPMVCGEGASEKAGSSWMGMEAAESSNWHKEAPAEEAAQQQQALIDSKPVDCTLHTVLRHIALVSHSTAANNAGRNRKIQVLQVLRVTSLTAVLGAVLCAGELPRALTTLSHVAFAGERHPRIDTWSSTWTWFCFQSACRGLELLMACAVASVTKQPVVRPTQPFAVTAPGASFRANRPSLYM